MDNGSILLNSESIQAMIATPGDYLQLKIDSTINCCPTIYTQTQALPLGVNSYFSFSASGVEVKPAFFNVISPNSIIDGVYYFNVKIFTDENNYHFEEDCAFIDITFKCKVAQYLDTLNDITEDGKISTNVHILHYALTNGSNCGCNCVAMCDVFKQLYDILKPITPQLQACGC
jgi:hypothetical protein